MKLIIAGSRDCWIRNDELLDLFNKFGFQEVTEIISGGARGIDSDGEEFAKTYDIPLKIFPADWKKYGLSAGPRRNREMAEYGDVLLLIWDGKSKGSANMKSRMLGLKKPVFEVIRGKR